EKQNTWFQKKSDILPPASAAQTIQAILDWIPARLTALSYALAGHFTPTFTYLRRHFLQFTPSGKLSADAGLMALERDKYDGILADAEENQAALTLVNHSLVIWIVVIALCTLAAWVA